MDWDLSAALTCELDFMVRTRDLGMALNSLLSEIAAKKARLKVADGSYWQYLVRTFSCCNLCTCMGNRYRLILF